MKTKMIVGLVLLVASIGIAQTYFAQKNVFNIYPEPTPGLALADWITYGSFKELLSNTDVIIIGEVVKSSVVTTPLPSPDNHPNSYTQTIHTVNIEKVYKGVINGDSVLIEQYGDNTKYILESPQLPTGEKMILFLYEYSPGKYNIVGGPQGRFHIVDGKVYSLGEVYSPAADLCKSFSTNGVSVESFINSLT